MSNATLYVCAPCKARGVKVNAVTRPRGDDGKKIALCQACADERNGVIAVSPEWTRAAHAWAWGLLGDARDPRSLWSRADHSAMTRKLSGGFTEAIADNIRDRFVETIVRDLPAGGEISADVLTFNDRPITVMDVFNAATRVHANLRDIPVDLDSPGNGAQDRAIFGLGQGISWDVNVIRELEPEDQLALLIFADDDTPDGREPTRDDATAWTRGVTVPVTRDITPRLREAAQRYVALKAQLASY